MILEQRSNLMKIVIIASFWLSKIQEQASVSMLMPILSSSSAIVFQFDLITVLLSPCSKLMRCSTLMLNNWFSLCFMIFLTTTKYLPNINPFKHYPESVLDSLTSSSEIFSASASSMSFIIFVLMRRMYRSFLIDIYSTLAQRYSYL